MSVEFEWEQRQLAVDINKRTEGTLYFNQVQERMCWRALASLTVKPANTAVTECKCMLRVYCQVHTIIPQF